METTHSNLKGLLCELIAEGNNDVSLPDISIDTEMGTKDDDNNGDSTGESVATKMRTGRGRNIE
jgi:hypothetical protein